LSNNEHSQSPPTACGICGSPSVTDLGHGSRLEGTVICHACGAKWWRRWYSRRDWETWINEEQPAARADERAEDLKQ